MKLSTLPTDSAERKAYPLFRGLLRYAPAALAGVSRISKLGNDKHNKGEEMHHARGKSSDHGDCVLRHMADVDALLAACERGVTHVENYTQPDGTVLARAPIERVILDEISCMSWRSLMWGQELHERFGGAPLAPGAKLPRIADTHEQETFGPLHEFPLHDARRDVRHGRNP